MFQSQKFNVAYILYYCVCVAILDSSCENLEKKKVFLRSINGDKGGFGGDNCRSNLNRGSEYFFSKLELVLDLNTINPPFLIVSLTFFIGSFLVIVVK